MKKSILFVVATMLSSTTYSQGRYFKMDGAAGSAFTVGNLKSYGLSGSLEPKYFITSNITAGLRVEGDILFGGTVNNETGNFDLGVMSRSAILLKGEYYVTNNKNRLFVGLMTGRYTQADIGSSEDDDVKIVAGKFFGIAPEIGVAFNNFRISGIYNLVPGTDLVAVRSSEPIRISRNYFVVQVGFKLFEIH